MTDEVKEVNPVGRPRISKGVIRRDGLTQEQAEWLKVESKRRGVSKFVLIREAIDLLISRSG
jgi:hypothetical protein